MQIKLTIDEGPAAGSSRTIEAGGSLTVGRSDQAGWPLRDDSMLSNLHFAIEMVDGAARLRDLQSRFGTTVNGSTVTAVVLNDGDAIRAGNSVFAVKVTGGVAALPTSATPTAPSAPMASLPVNEKLPSKSDGGVLSVLRGQRSPLYAILDAAREPPVVVQKVLHSGEQHESLYDGPVGETLANFGPYLVSLPKESGFLTALADEGWGRSWGVYLTSRQPFAEVRKHLRRFLTVLSPENKKMYFRFYDPRVLRVYLPNCNATELADFFGPIECFMVEGEKPSELTRFAAVGGGTLQTDSMTV